MTRSVRSQAHNPEIVAIIESVDDAMREGRFDAAFYRDALQRVADARGDFADNHYVHQVAVKAGLIPSVMSVIQVKGQRWDPVRRAFVPV